MSFVPNPTQANASNNPNAKVNPSSSAAGGGTAAPPATGGGEETTGDDWIFKIRTYDVYWVEKNALMYRDGVSKVRKELS
jgi:hypothetical protein